MRFYFKALEYPLPEEKQIKNILGQLFCDGNLIGVAPDLHRSCGKIFSQLNEIEQNELKSKSDESKISYKFKKIKLFRREDLKDLKHLKVEMGLMASKASYVWKVLKWFGVILRGFGKWVLLKALDNIYRFGNLSFRVKLGSFAALLLLIIGGNIFKDRSLPFRSQRSGESIGISIPSKVKKGTLYTVQIAAFLYKKQATKMMVNLRKEKVKNLYVEKSKRNSAAGYWYKVRAGKFESQSEASDFANQLVAAKTVRNYFIISLPKK